ncbi:unnamed protein product [Mytilus coruscus]|uniref:Uncharacterized protein n=1 Tax=Mytilus coruscus TaxID=42192 RepID=A0A6J8AA58_MYTCO|nr:unnamed protein product [Mytilus coruscus]
MEKHLHNYSLSAVNKDTLERKTDVDIRENSHVPAMTIMLWNHFQEQPGMLHEEFKNGYYPGQSSERILDITGGLADDALAMFEVHSIDDFLHTSYDIQNKLLLFRTKIKHERVIRVSEKHFNTEWWKDEFAVLVNTSSEEIRDKLVLRLQQARDDFEKGRKFCLQLDFSQGLESWYADVCERNTPVIMHWYGRNDDRNYGEDSIENLSVFILNWSKPVKCFLSKWMILCCFPCWLFSGGCCYYIHRKSQVDDMKDKFKLPVSFRSVSHLPQQEDTPCCYFGKIYHLPLDSIRY